MTAMTRAKSIRLAMLLPLALALTATVEAVPAFHLDNTANDDNDSSSSKAQDEWRNQAFLSHRSQRRSQDHLQSQSEMQRPTIRSLDHSYRNRVGSRQSLQQQHMNAELDDNDDDPTADASQQQARLMLSEVATSLLQTDDGDDSTGGVHYHSNPFVQELQRQEQEWRRQRELDEDEAATAQKQGRFLQKSPQTSLLSLLGTGALLGIATVFDPTITTVSIEGLQKLAKDSISALLLSWIPILLLGDVQQSLGVGWVELSSAAFVMLQTSSVRQYLIQTILPTMRTTMRKLLLAEMWKQIWSIVWSPLPQPMFTPKELHLREGVPQWLLSPLQYATKLIDKYTQGLIKSNIKENVMAAVGGITSSAELPEITVLQWREMAQEDQESVELYVSRDVEEAGANTASSGDSRIVEEQIGGVESIEESDDDEPLVEDVAEEEEEWEPVEA